MSQHPQRYPTVLLRHDTPDPGNSHHDWMLLDPKAVASPSGSGSIPSNATLWTARVVQPSTLWRSLTSWDLVPLPPHRDVYLTYQGPLTPGSDGSPRGSVIRSDEGDFAAIVWAEDHFIIDLRFQRCSGVIEARQVTPSLWRAVWAK